MNKIINYPGKKTLLISETNYTRKYLSNLDKNKKYLIITDDNLYKHYKDLLNDYDVIIEIVPNGETSKNFNTYLHILNVLFVNNFTRNDAIIAFGGGVITDLSLFVAGTYQRGIDITLIPTSLLAMVDASIGGKCGINFNGCKNQIGMFYFPSQIIIDDAFLNTLPKEEYYNGFAEIIKCSLIKDKNMFEQIENNEFNISDLIIKSIEIKLSVIENDIYDSKERKLLNFGHTYGHIIESDSNFQIKHGHAIAIGMYKETKDFIIKNRLYNLLSKFFDLNYEINNNNIYKYLQKDKKSTKNTIDVVELKNIGESALITKPVEEVLNEYIWEKH